MASVISTSWQDQVLSLIKKFNMNGALRTHMTALRKKVEASKSNPSAIVPILGIVMLLEAHAEINTKALHKESEQEVVSKRFLGMRSKKETVTVRRGEDHPSLLIGFIKVLVLSELASNPVAYLSSDRNTESEAIDAINEATAFHNRGKKKGKSKGRIYSMARLKPVTDLSERIQKALDDVLSISFDKLLGNAVKDIQAYRQSIADMSNDQWVPEVSRLTSSQAWSSVQSVVREDEGASLRTVPTNFFIMLNMCQSEALRRANALLDEYESTNASDKTVFAVCNEVTSVFGDMDVHPDVLRRLPLVQLEDIDGSASFDIGTDRLLDAAKHLNVALKTMVSCTKQACQQESMASFAGDEVIYDANASVLGQ